MRKIKSLICTVIVIAIILGISIVASAGTTGYFTNATIYNDHYVYLTYSIKSTNNTNGTGRISSISGGSYVMLRAGTSSATSTAIVRGIGSFSNQPIPSAYCVVGDAINLYCHASGSSVGVTGYWNAN